MVKRFNYICLTMLLCAFAAQALTLRGAVTNASNDAAVVGAVVTLTAFGGGGTNTYTDTSIAAGRYEMLNVRQTAGMLTVNATGFTAFSQYVSNLQAVDTVDVALTPTGGVVTGTKKILGTVTESGGNAVATARLILLLRSGGGAASRPVDTVQSAGDGKYLFDSLASGRYDIIVTKTGFLENVATTNLNLTTADSVVANITLLSVGNRVGTLTGKVTKTDSTTAIEGAKVLLTRTVNAGGAVTTTTIDSTLTLATGVYTIASVPVATGYRLTVSAAGYENASSPNTFRVDSAISRTENFRLRAIVPPSGIVKGAVTDSASLGAIPGAQVILRQRQANTTWLAIDTLASAANGSFSFTGLAVGTYSLVVNKTDFRPYTTPNNQALNLTTNPDTATVSVVLAPIAKGNLYVYTDNAGAAVAGVAVSAVQKLANNALGMTYTGVTAANGYVGFPSAVAGTYDITVSKAGFNTMVRAGVVVAGNANDTAKITLVVATGTSKLVKGTVKSVAGAGLDAVVVLNARNGGGAVLTLLDTCGADGAYSISGIPVGYTTISLTVTKSGYITKDSTGISIANDTSTVNVILAAIVKISDRSNAKVGLNVMMSNGVIYLQTGSANIPTNITLYSASGSAVYHQTFTESNSLIAIPAAPAHQLMLVVVQQGNEIIRQKLLAK